MAEAQLIRCPACGTKNRVPQGKIERGLALDSFLPVGPAAPLRSRPCSVPRRVGRPGTTSGPPDTGAPRYSS